MQLGWTRPDPIMATKELIAPLVGGLLGMIIIPGVAYKTVLLYFPEVFQDNRFTCKCSLPCWTLFKIIDHCQVMHVYPLVFIVASAVRSAVNLYGALSAWSIAIRDKEFLVEMRLRNHEPPETNKPVLGADTTSEVGVDPDRPALLNVLVEQGNQA